jgi:intermediate peptidase
MYMGINSATPQQLSTLHDLLQSRAQLATLLGSQSFGHMYLCDKMARTPEHVAQFLQGLADDNRGAADAEMAALRRVKKAITASNEPIFAWYTKQCVC